MSFRETITQRVPSVFILAAIAIIFAGLDAAFIFAGPMLPYSQASLTVFLFAGAVLMAVMGLFSSFRCVFTGFQDEAMVILAVVVGSIGASAEVVDDSLYATALVMVMVSTVLTGAFFFLLGELRMGRMIRYVPFSVTAGFMITVGGLLMSGGIALAEGSSITELAGSIASDFALPTRAGFAIGVAILLGLCAKRLGHMRALPAAITISLLGFYLVAWLSSSSHADLVAGSWLQATAADQAHEHGWSIVMRSAIDWDLVTEQWSSLASIAMISALALLLAVTALELSTRQNVDVDRELRAAGLANLCTGLVGGSTGYHEDAVTSMLHRDPHADKVTLLLAAILCAGVSLLDPGWFAYIPMPILGGLLIWLGWQLWREWLFQHGRYLHRTDWLAVIAIIAVTIYAGFIAGVLLGLGVGIALFLVDYSQVRTVRYAVNGREIRSNVDRSPDAEQVLYDEGQRIHVVKLQGYLFFARAHQVLLQLEPVMRRTSHGEQRFAIIDFFGVAGVDSTATMAFVRLKQMAVDAGATLVFTGLRIETRVDLARVELADGFIRYFDQLDEGLAFCEEELLNAHEGEYEKLVSASQIFDEILDLSQRSNNEEQYLEQIHVAPGELLIEAGAEADDIYLVESGSLNVVIEGIDHRPMVVRGLEAGSVFGEMALYLGGARSASVIASTEAVVRRLDHASLQRMESENPQLAMVVHSMLARLLALKLRQTNTWLSHLR